MEDKKTTLLELKKKAEVFLEERNWKQFHNPKTDSMNIAVEVAELMEIFLYDNIPTDTFITLEKKRAHVEDEVGDVIFALLTFANTANIDLAAAFEKKLVKTAAKYPVEKVKGCKDKYDEYHEGSLSEK